MQLPFRKIEIKVENIQLRFSKFRGKSLNFQIESA